MLRLAAGAASLLLLAGCVGGPARAPTSPAFIPVRGAGLERVMGQPARALTQLFGQPDADVQEGPARKLQFGSRICVLDTYLYPPSNGREPLVTYLETRQRDGSAIDRASCIAALTRREGGK